MTDPSIKYDCGRVHVLIESEDYLAERFRITATRDPLGVYQRETTMVHCNDGIGAAQALARMLVGVEMTEGGAAIWPDGRTGPSPTLADKEPTP